jgi:drug/metabolite transporter (DMT)-like permease
VKPVIIGSSITNANTFTRGLLLVFMGSICFSTKAIFVKLCLLHGVDGITALMLRMLFALPFYVLFPFVSKEVNMRLFQTAPWGRIAFLGLVGYYLASLFDFLGLQYIQANLERLIVFIYPTLVLLLGAIIFGRRISLPQMVAVFMCYAGIIVACLSQDFDLGGRQIWMGILFVALSALTYSIYLVFSDNIIAQIGSVAFTCFSMVISSVAVLVHYGIVHGVQLMGFDWQVYVFGLLMAVISTIIPTLFLTRGIGLIGSGNAAVISSVGPVATISMSYFILHEPFTSLQGVGTILVIAGVAYLGYKGSREG